MAREDLVYEMNRARQPFNTNSLAQIAAIAALKDREYVTKLKKMNTEGKQFLYTSLDKMGIEYVPSEANFILIKVGDADRVYQNLLYADFR